MMVYQVDDTTMADAVLSSEGKLQILHDGEKELLAYATNVSGIFYISSQDRACVRVGAKMGFLDRFVSLRRWRKRLAESASLCRGNTPGNGSPASGPHAGWRSYEQCSAQ